MPFGVAIVAEAQVDALVQPGGGDTRLAVLQLRAGDGEAGHAAAACGGGAFRERAPSAADLQQVMRRVHLEQLQQALVLGLLRLVEAQRRFAGEERARIGHAGIEPLGVERVAQVVVRANVAARARPRVGAQQVRHAQEESAQRIAVEHLRQRFLVGGAQAQQRHHVGRLHQAVAPRFEEPHLGAAQHHPQGLPVPDAQVRLGAVAAVATTHALGRHQYQPPVLEAREQSEQRTRGPRRFILEVQAIGGIQREVSFMGDRSGLANQGTPRAHSRSACQWMRRTTPRVIHG